MRVVMYLLLILIVPGNLIASEVEKVSYSDGEIIDLVRNKLGYKSIELRKEGVFALKVEGKKMFLFNNGSAGLQLSYSVESEKTTLEDLNAWNLYKKFSQASQSRKNVVRLSSYLPTGGGVYDSNVKAFFARFKFSVRGFQKHLLAKY